MVRSIVAIIVGYLIYASILTGSVMSLFTEADAGAALAPLLLGKGLAAIVIAVLLGGGAAAAIGSHHLGEHGATVGLLAAAVTVVGLFTTQSVEPTWFRLATAVLAVPTGWVAGLLVQNIKSRT